MNNNRIRLIFDWVKGVKVDIPYSKFVMFSVGVYILSLAASRLIESIAAVVH